jgi:hypothetical protein
MGRLAKLVCVLLLASKGTGEIPEGRSEHFITVGGADGARRYFVVRNPSSAPTMAVLLLHDSVKPEDADGLVPGARSEVRAFESRLGDAADLWEGNGALLVCMCVYYTNHIILYRLSIILFYIDYILLYITLSLSLSLSLTHTHTHTNRSSLRAETRAAGAFAGGQVRALQVHASRALDAACASSA